MTTSPMLSSSRPLDPFVRGAATVLVATDGTEQSDGALRVALARAAEMRAGLEIVAVATVEPLVAPEASFALWSESNLNRRNLLREGVEAQLERVTGHPHSHPIVVLDGHPAFTIARTAMEQRAALIVVGLGRHNVADRLFSDETALQLARISRVPVLAVPASARAVPRHAIVALDFSDISLRAAQSAIEAVSDDGQVELVHVMPFVNEAPFTLDGREPYKAWTSQQLDALMANLAVPPGVTVRAVTVRGRPAPELLSFASRVNADLIVTGSHGRGFVARAFLGSVTTKLMRAATCCVLAVPRDPLPALTSQQDITGHRPLRGEEGWPALLEDFTRRNVARRSILEVDDIEIGAQGQEYNYPLVAALYDAQDRRLEITLGDRSAQGRRLSRSVGGVVGMDVLTDGHGHDVALRVEHGSGHTLLTFAP